MSVDTIPMRPSPFPFAYYADLMKNLISRGDVEFLTYADLEWVSGDDGLKRYPLELRRWRESLANGTRNPDKIYLILQHDCDSAPRHIIEMANFERRLGIRSNLMVFDRWFPWYMKKASDKQKVPSHYPIDWEALRSLAEDGFMVGYHCNAWQNVRFNENLIFNQFRKEVASLEKKLGRSIRFYSAHGGARSPDGRVNASFDYFAIPKLKAIWVHNRINPRYSSAYSDGAINARLRGDDAEKTNFEKFLTLMQPGNRYLALIHPEYYLDTSYMPHDDVTVQYYLEMRKKYSKYEAKNKL